MGSALDEALARLANPYYDYPLPSWLTTYRPHQVEAIDRIVGYFNDVDVLVLEAPTGAGKTVIGETVRQVMGCRGVYMCSTKTLQDQVARDFPYARVLKGRSNYPTELYPDRFGDKWESLSTAECTKQPGSDTSCQWCSTVHNCPYEQAKHGALRSDLAILNTSYFLTEGNGPGRFSGRGLVIADECDTLEREVMGYVSVEIGEKKDEEVWVE